MAIFNDLFLREAFESDRAANQIRETYIRLRLFIILSGVLCVLNRHLCLSFTPHKEPTSTGIKPTILRSIT